MAGICSHLQTSLRAHQATAARAAARSSLQLLLLTGVGPADLTAVSPARQGAGTSHVLAREPPPWSSRRGRPGRAGADSSLLSRRTCRPRAAGMLAGLALAPGMGTNRQLTQAEAAAGRPRGTRMSEILVLPAGAGLSRQLTCAEVAVAVAGARALWVQSLCSLLGLAGREGALAALGDVAGAAHGTPGTRSAPCHTQRDLGRCEAGMQCWAARSRCLNLLRRHLLCLDGKSS